MGVPEIVFLVEDEDSIRRAFTRLLRSHGYVVKGSASAEEFLDAGDPVAEAGCVLLDLQLPEQSGLMVQRALHERDNGLPIVFITGHGSIPASVQAMKGGAVEFLTKPVPEPELLRAVKEAVALSRSELPRAAEVREARRRLALLTPREREVMELVVQGRANKRIAYELGTVEKTIKVHRGRIMHKMAAESVAALVRTAERLGL